MFLRNVRPLDGKTSITDIEDYKIDRQWDVLSLFTLPTNSFTFDDYLRVESVMELWYTNGKLEATGYA